MYMYDQCWKSIIQQIKENGGLAKLIAFIVDAPPPEDEDAKSKGKKGNEKGGSRAGKKGKDEGLSFQLELCYE